MSGRGGQDDMSVAWARPHRHPRASVHVGPRVGSGAAEARVGLDLAHPTAFAARGGPAAKRPDKKIRAGNDILTLNTGAPANVGALRSGATLRVSRETEDEDMTYRTITSFVFSAIFAGGLAMGTAHADEDDAPGPCKAKKFEIEAVKKACDAGGAPAAKKIMKDAVKKAKAAGDDMNCKTCHESTKEFEKHKEGSVDKLKKLL